jgi:PleD family two-component response regulator
MSKNFLSLLAVIPTQHVTPVLGRLPSKYSITTVNTTESAQLQLAKSEWDGVIMSTQLSPHKQLELLEIVKTKCRERIIPVIYLIDLQNRLTTILGTSWGDTLGIFHSLSSEAEVASTLKRLFSKS